MVEENQRPSGWRERSHHVSAAEEAKETALMNPPAFDDRMFDKIFLIIEI